MAVPKYLPYYTYLLLHALGGMPGAHWGHPFAMSPQPSLRHQRVSQRIATGIERALEGRERCRAILPVDWKIPEDTMVQPDKRRGDYRGVSGQTAHAHLRGALAVYQAKRRVVKAELYALQGVQIMC